MRPRTRTLSALTTLTTGVVLAVAMPATADRPGPTARGAGVAHLSPPARPAAHTPAGRAGAALTTLPATGFDGLGEARSGGNPPDPGVALGGGRLVETANRRIEVYRQSDGADLCGWSFAAFTGASEDLSAARVLYDPAGARFSLVLRVAAAWRGTVPALYVASSITGDACGRWYVYRLDVAGSLYPAGATLDTPYLGQDANALIVTSNTLDAAGRYLDSTAFALPKTALYAGAPVSFTAFAVQFCTAPARVQGGSAAAYLLAAVPGRGYDLYRMTGAGTPAASLTGPVYLPALVLAPAPAPQPGTSATLSTLDGRIASEPTQVGDRLWFAHTVRVGGRTSVRYGSVTLDGAGTPAVSVATLHHSMTSADLNPSIAVTGTGRVVLNWAYTDVDAPASATVLDLAAQAPITNLTTAGTMLVSGGTTTASAVFGRYSAVSADPTGTGCDVATVQEYFGPTGAWLTRLAVLPFC